MIGFTPEELTKLFSLTLRFKGNVKYSHKEEADPELAGKILGVVDGATWISIWGDYFGKLLLPGVKLMHVGDDSIQNNFIKAKEEGRQVPPEENIERFCDYAVGLHEFGADAVILTCSTMNRSYRRVKERLAPYNCPVIQIDVPMMRAAALSGKKVGLLVTLDTSVRSSELLLEEVAAEEKRSVDYKTYLCEEAFAELGRGEIESHNQRLAGIIKKAVKEDGIGIMVLAQLSMGVFQFDYPEPEKTFGIPVLNSGYTGFKEARDVLAKIKK